MKLLEESLISYFLSHQMKELQFVLRKSVSVFWLFVKSWGGILQNPALFLCLELFYVYKFYVDN